MIKSTNQSFNFSQSNTTWCRLLKKRI